MHYHGTTDNWEKSRHMQAKECSKCLQLRKDMKIYNHPWLASEMYFKERHSEGDI